jgi:hypothetical protein
VIGRLRELAGDGRGGGAGRTASSIGASAEATVGTVRGEPGDRHHARLSRGVGVVRHAAAEHDADAAHCLAPHELVAARGAGASIAGQPGPSLIRQRSVTSDHAIAHHCIAGKADHAATTRLPRSTQRSM